MTILTYKPFDNYYLLPTAGGLSLIIGYFKPLDGYKVKVTFNNTVTIIFKTI